MKDNFVVHFGILITGILIAAYFFVFFKFNTFAQTIVVGLSCIYYVSWGIIHHALKSRLNSLIVLEYMLVGSLIFLLFYTSLSL